jgi:hypothetical protein
MMPHITASVEVKTNNLFLTPAQEQHTYSSLFAKCKFYILSPKIFIGCPGHLITFIAKLSLTVN